MAEIKILIPNLISETLQLKSSRQSGVEKKRANGWQEKNPSRKSRRARDDGTRISKPSRALQRAMGRTSKRKG